MRNLAHLLHHRVSQTPDQRAIRHLDQTLTWRQLYSRAMAVRDHLHTCGVQRADVVAIHINHSLAQVIALFGIALADAVFTVVSVQLKSQQIQHQIMDCGTNHILTMASKRKLLEKMFAYRDTQLTVLHPSGVIENRAEPETIQTLPEQCHTRSIPTDVGCIIYTSGSSGKPKGVVVPHRTLLDGARIVSGYLKITQKDRILSILPYNFDYGLNQLLSCVQTGANIVLAQFTFPKDILTILREEEITAMAGVPSMWPHFFLADFLDAKTRTPLPHLRYVTTAGGKHPMSLLEKLTALFAESDLIIMYGLTESFRSSYLPFSELFKRPGSIGKAVPEVELLVVNKEGNPCAPGEIGELIHRGAFVTYGYLNNPERTAEKFQHLATGGPGCLPEIAVRSGDLVSMDEEGYLYFHERADTQIKCSGYRISPSEVEEAVLAVPGIKQVAVFGQPSEMYGEVVVAAYATFDAEPMPLPHLKKALIHTLPSYAVPQFIQHYTALPTTASGKIDYPALKQHAEQLDANQAI
ncbi:AMP-binding protein [Magnetococcus sp. PR-3]|uniref:AMP-binding protein n=1 Tax=Magnetococcus sp. PR-3 TaxID=3120355 RepID=UPI002FCE5C70